MSDPTRHDGLSGLLAGWAAEEAKQPVRATPAMLRVKAELARSDRARASAERIERWGFGLSGILLLAASVAPIGSSLDSVQGLAAGGSLGLVALAAAGWSFARALRA